MSKLAPEFITPLRNQVLIRMEAPDSKIILTGDQTAHRMYKIVTAVGPDVTLVKVGDYIEYPTNPFLAPVEAPEKADETPYALIE